MFRKLLSWLGLRWVNKLRGGSITQNSALHVGNSLFPMGEHKVSNM